ncbi:hypothetical protein [Maritimibacter sp. UBA3975]|uniref:hypothetical protein n=1 Tax=Maritimibacter sp. UBA3975 TaxID=1946833 RepID=UPI0025BE236A|nr:hypothetical protein [Maritimibacter sp. UBA3975]
MKFHVQPPGADPRGDDPPFWSKRRITLKVMSLCKPPHVVEKRSELDLRRASWQMTV